MVHSLNPNGKKNTEGKYDNDKKIGVWRSFREDGSKLEEVEYVNDLQEGKFTRWHPNGVKEVEGQYKAGKKEGTWKFTDQEDGELLRTEDYKADQLIKKTIKKQPKPAKPGEKKPAAPATP